ncbi:MAG: hypothetical protein GKS06_16920 [Acidobacteria bacterium]|nr:hypothetical protein [Acidobacteriota bacterium]
MQDQAPSGHFRDERGFGLLMTLLLVMLVATIAGASARVASTEMEVVGNYRGLSRAFYSADGAAQAAVDSMVTIGRGLGRFPTDGELSSIAAPTVTGTSFTTHTVLHDGVQVIEPLQSGYYQGLNAYTMPFSIDVTAETTDWPLGRSSVGMGVLFDIIPIFQFAIFYHYDLEILPGPTMLLNGRVHSNHDIYLNTGNTLTIDSSLTTAGDVYHRRKDKSASQGNVEVRESSGVFASMNGLDSDDADWYEDALDRWNGNVRSAVHGIEPLNLTIADPTDPRSMIEKPLSADTTEMQASKMSHQADLTILNGIAVDGLGIPISTTDPITGDDAVRATVLFDPREQRDMLTIEVDMEKLGRSPAWPANGLIYVASDEPADLMPAWTSGCAGCWGPADWDGYAEPWTSTSTGFAVKVTNGSDLTAPLTVASDNPLYVRGDYNTVNKVGAALMADAITVLSNNWGRVGQPTADPDDDLAYSALSMSSRVAGNTQLNAAVMLGNTETQWGSYNGGVENVLRFVEKWSGKTLVYRGSIIDLWYAEQAIGAWKYGSPVYQAPGRDWAFDTDFLDVANLPPFTPHVYTVRVSDWRRE